MNHLESFNEHIEEAVKLVDIRQIFEYKLNNIQTHNYV